MRLAIGIRDIVPNSQVGTEIYLQVQSTYIYTTVILYTRIQNVLHAGLLVRHFPLIAGHPGLGTRWYL